MLTRIRPRAPAGPPRAGRRAPWREAAFAAIDLETTGLDLARDHIVSYGIVPVVGGRARLADSVHQLILPPTPPSPRSQTIHLLRPVDLQDSPSIAEASEGLRRALDGRYVLAWFAEVEIGFLSRELGGSERAWRRRTIDVRNLAIAADGQPASVRGDQGYALGTLARRHGVPVAAPHEAFDDALVAAQLFLVLATKLPGGEPTVRDLLRIAGA
jgi:DNA polymerase-3 subunit epsilon